MFFITSYMLNLKLVKVLQDKAGRIDFVGDKITIGMLSERYGAIKSSSLLLFNI